MLVLMLPVVVNYTLLQWLRSQEAPFPWNKQTYLNAKASNFDNIVEWLESQNAPK